MEIMFEKQEIKLSVSVHRQYPAYVNKNTIITLLNKCITFKNSALFL